MNLSLVRAAASSDDDSDELLREARAGLEAQARALRHVASRLDSEFCAAVELMLKCRGRVVVCGVGKSGLIGRKLAATFSCSGTPSAFLHAAEASHGDLGMVTRADVMVLVSNSGSTGELVWLLPYFRELGVALIAIVGDGRSPLARAADAVLDVSVDAEICPHNLLPTTSALSMLAVGDALAVALMNKRAFTAEEFARFHPGGALGRRLNDRVADSMKTRDLPLAAADVTVREALLTMSAGRCGLVVIVDTERRPVGIVTDGDLRRGLHSRGDLLSLPLSSVMTKPPVTIRQDVLAHEASERMRRLRIKALVVVNEDGQVVGIADIFDE